MAIEERHATMAIGWLSAELAARSGAWEGKAPDWFPQPPEWLELWDKGLAATAEEAAQQAGAEDATVTPSYATPASMNPRIEEVLEHQDQQRAERTGQEGA